MPARDAVTLEWLEGVLTRAGYETKISPQAPEQVLAKHTSRPNVSAKVLKNQGIILFTSFWGLKKSAGGIFSGGDKTPEALNGANNLSFYLTFSRDKDGDLMVSSYIFLTEEVSEADVESFLERSAISFYQVVANCGLKDHLA